MSKDSSDGNADGHLSRSERQADQEGQSEDDQAIPVQSAFERRLVAG
jgi:hypothetical protein